jgi:hypothetical protein
VSPRGSAFALAAVVSTAAGCKGAAPSDALVGTWVADVVQNPASFSSVVDGAGERDAWIALHKNDWLAIETGSGVASQRAETEIAVLEGILDRANTEAVRTLAEGWTAHSPDVPVPAWLTASVQRLSKPALPSSPFAVDSPATTAPSALRATFIAPLADATLGTFWDPTRPLALKRAYDARAKPTPEGLAGALFGPIAMQPTPPATDEVGACRAFGQAFNTAVDAGAAALAASAPEEGQALLRDLGLVEVARSRTLTALAVSALYAEHPTCAAWYAAQALDHTAPRSITPTNSPTVYAVIGAANIQLGHVREALDALNVLRPDGPYGYPEALGVIEAVSDLAVQQGMDRNGASGEN